MTSPIETSSLNSQAEITVIAELGSELTKHAVDMVGNSALAEVVQSVELPASDLRAERTVSISGSVERVDGKITDAQTLSTEEHLKTVMASFVDAETKGISLLKSNINRRMGSLVVGSRLYGAATGAGTVAFIVDAAHLANQHKNPGWAVAGAIGMGVGALFGDFMTRYRNNSEGMVRDVETRSKRLGAIKLIKDTIFQRDQQPE